MLRNYIKNFSIFFLCIICTLFWLVSVKAKNADNSAFPYNKTGASSEIIFEQNYEIRSKGKKTGILRVIQRNDTIEDGIPVVITKKHIEQKFKRLDSLVEITQSQTFVEDKTGRPLLFNFKSQNKSEKIELSGRFNWQSGEIIVNSKINDIKDSRIIDIEDKILFPYAISNLYKEKEDKNFKYHTLEPGINLQVLEVQVEKTGEELLKEGDLDGVYKKYKNKVNIFPDTDIYVWKDDQGRTAKEYTSILDMEQVAVKKEDITDIPPDFDIFSESIIKVNKNISDPNSIEQVIYKISADNTPVHNIFLNNNNQKIIQIKDKTVYLKVKAENYKDYRFKYPVEIDVDKKYLRSGPFIVSDSEKIRKLASVIVGEEQDALKIAKKMEKWVFNNIKNKNYSLDFANPVKTLETRSGDCTEHSMLLASLLRAAGIPSKVVIGLVYTNKPENAFVYHMWVKAYVGRWVSLDPSIPYRNFTPLHLAMAESSLNNISAKSDLIINIINSFSQLDIEILNISKTLIQKDRSEKPEIKINLSHNNLMTGNNFVDVKISKIAQGEIQKIRFPKESKKDYIKESFYDFTLGNTEKALVELKEFYKSIDPNDDFLKMKLVLKLINMSYFNFAEKVFDDINNKEIWGQLISDLKILYFPKKLLPDEKESIRVTSFYALNYKDNPDFVIELTQKIENYDYIYYLRAEAFIKNNEYDKARKEIDKAIEINPDNLSYRLSLIEILSGQNKIRKAQEALSYINLIAKRNNVKDKKFWKKFKTYDYWLKVKQFRENIVLSKYYQAYYYLIKGEFNSAAKILNKLVSNENESYLHELLAEVYYEIDQYDSAKNYYEKALTLEETRTKANIGLGNIYFLYGQYSVAEKYYKRITEIRPRNKEALLSLAKLESYLGNKEEAFDYFKKILEIEPDNTEVLYNLGIILGNRGNFEEAEKLIKKVIAADPMSHPEVWLDLVRVEMAQGYYAEAVKYLKNVNYIDENNVYYYYYMAIILKKNGNTEEAKKYLKKALELEPELIEELKGNL